MNRAEWGRRRASANRRVASAMKKWGGVDPYPSNWARTQLTCDRLSFTENAIALEKLFPGCSVAWDVNPVTRSWTDYDLEIRPHDPIQYLGVTTVHSREAHHHARLWGHHVLVGVKLDSDGLRDRIKVTDPHRYSTRMTRTAWYVPQEERWTVIQ